MGGSPQKKEGKGCKDVWYDQRNIRGCVCVSGVDPRISGMAKVTPTSALG